MSGGAERAEARELKDIEFRRKLYGGDFHTDRMTRQQLRKIKRDHLKRVARAGRQAEIRIRRQRKPA